MGLAARPGRGVPAIHDELVGLSERPGFERAAEQSRGPGGPGRSWRVEPRNPSLWSYIRRFFGGQF